jgi:hypothetical protein
MFSSKRIWVLTITLALASCDNVDPADIALAERDTIASLVTPGAPFTAVKSGLEAQGYECNMSSGNFMSETGETRSAPSFTQCVKRTQSVMGCAIQIRIVALAEDERLSQVHFLGGGKCI